VIEHQWLTFIDMGGYARYVWSAYGVVLLLFCFFIGKEKLSWHLILKKIKKDHVKNT
jgi:heme exporter protein CcmD